MAKKIKSGWTKHVYEDSIAWQKEKFHFIEIINGKHLILIRDGKLIKKRIFKSKKQALKAARAYIKRH